MNTKHEYKKIMESICLSRLNKKNVYTNQLAQKIINNQIKKIEMEKRNKLKQIGKNLENLYPTNT